MALDESAVSDLLDALRVGEGTDLVRELAQWALQQLIDTEATEKIGADPVGAFRGTHHPSQRDPAATSPRPQWPCSTTRATLTQTSRPSPAEHTEDHPRNPTTSRDSVDFGCVPRSGGGISV